VKLLLTDDSLIVNVSQDSSDYMRGITETSNGDVLIFPDMIRYRRFDTF
nr:hypothetical protein [Tanacetum cinerariifolium]